MKKTLHKILAVTIAASLMTVSLSGCTYRITDKTVEEEVAEALAEAEAQWAVEKQQAVEQATKAALEENQKQEQDEDGDLIQAKDVPEPDKIMMNEEQLDSVSMAPTEANDEGNVESEIEEPTDDVLQIVFMGDSIFDSVRDETGIARMVGTSLGADIYNLSIGGTSCALRMDKITSLDDWNEPSFMGMVYALEGKVDRDFLDGYKAGEVMKTLDPAKTDYFIIQYGTNDFLSYIPINSSNTNGQIYFYFAPSLILGVRELQEKYPDAQIILCTPYYEQFWSADRTRYIGDAHMTNNGFGT
ncbi:MAG: hypothetical protein K5673_00925, partial [Lachnospiraceae bacterium]|nr:hypothetical protein [Lachnospiraceae bacterium]